jgi:hypothetical protein
MCAYPLLGQVGGGWALEISSFLGPKWHSPIGSMPFHRPKKLLISKAQKFYINESIARLSTVKRMGHEMNYVLTTLLWRKFLKILAYSLSDTSQKVYCCVL